MISRSEASVCRGGGFVFFFWTIGGRRQSIICPSFNCGNSNLVSVSEEYNYETKTLQSITMIMREKERVCVRVNDACMFLKNNTVFQPRKVIFVCLKVK
jgi:hypothetical protein